MEAQGQSRFVLTGITNDRDLARTLDLAGVDRIGIDIERLGKRERQGHIPGARISDHELADLEGLRTVVRRAALFVRLNPFHDGSASEVTAAVGAGATVLMLPYFTSAAEVDAFVSTVDRRATTVLLLETAAAVVRLHEVLAVDGIDEVIVGLNDLHLTTGVASHFELVASDLMTMIGDAVRRRGARFGFGGLARADDTTLPVPSDLVLAQHARLGSTSSWLSRSFYRPGGSPAEISTDVAKLRDRLGFWKCQPEEVLAEKHESLRQHLRRWLD